VVPQTRAADVLDLPERVVELVCRQDHELLLWDAGASKMFTLPESQSGPWVAEVPANSPVRVKFYAGQPLWVSGPAEQIAPADRPRD
jgi:hypothetical protein